MSTSLRSPPGCLRDLRSEDFLDLVTATGGGLGRARRLLAASLRSEVDDPLNLTGVARDTRLWLSRRGWWVRPLKLHQVSLSATDPGTAKYLFLTRDGLPVETVSMPASGGRSTVCLSCQVGCAMGCRMCSTAAMGLVRNLSSGEMISQYSAVAADHLRRGLNPPTNVVFMGMGEPFANTEPVFRATDMLNHSLGWRVSRDRMTISTCGIVPGIRALGARGHRTNLAVSLNAPNDVLRSHLMPVNQRWPLKELIESLHTYPLRPGRTIVIEYVLIGGVNDGPHHATQLKDLLRHLPIKINLIAFNPSPTSSFHRPTDDRLSHFARCLAGVGRGVIIRRSRGGDVSAACGQLGSRYASIPNCSESRKT